jgi:hypothetical protein
VPQYNHYLRFFCRDLVRLFFKLHDLLLFELSRICYVVTRNGTFMSHMIQGTRAYRGKNQPEEKPSTLTGNLAEPTEAFALGGAESARQTEEPVRAPTESNAMNQLDRRAWFASLVPALGDGLVKILRASNNLRDDLHHAAKDPTR